MKPGRELDALIAENVMGWHYYSGRDNDPCEKCSVRHKDHWHVAPFPKPSTDIAAAWEIIEKIPMTVYAPGASFADGEYRNMSYRDSDGEWQNDGKFWGAEATVPELDSRGFARVWAPTAPLAICLAALKAVGVEVP